MVRRRALAGTAAAVLALTSPVLAQTAPGSTSGAMQEVVEVRVHGNHSMPDAEVLAIAGIRVGERVDAEHLAGVEQRLRDSGRFASVDVLRRYRSLSSTDRVVLIVTVQEKVAAGRKLLVLPLLRYNEDQGFSFGGAVSADDLLGGGEFLSVPLLIGGYDRAALEIRKDWESGVSVGGAFEGFQFENPHFEVRDRRVQGTAFVQYRLGEATLLRADGSYGDVHFGEARDRLTTVGFTAAYDTRPDIHFPRDAVHLSGTWEAVKVRGQPMVSRYRLEVAGYKTLFGQTVIATRGLARIADGPLPEYEKPYVGGMVSLRGYRAGAFSGDNAVLTTAEIRIPFNAPRGIGRYGLTLFWDGAAVWDDAGSLGAASFNHGLGAGAFVQLPIVRLNIDVGNDLRGSTRVHFGLGFRF